MPSDPATTIAIIPARGGSKRLPRKNVVDFFGKPIIAYTIEAALESGCFRRVVVSADDDEISDVARRFGAEVDRRPALLAGDDIGCVDVCLELLDREAAAGHADEVLCCLYATAPMRGAADIRAVLDLLQPGRCDFAMAVTELALPPWQALKLAADGRADRMFPDLFDKREQEIGPLMVDNGSTYAMRIAALRRHRAFVGPGVRCYEMPRGRSVDINVQEDLDLAAYHYGRLSA